MICFGTSYAVYETIVFDIGCNLKCILFVGIITIISVIVRYKCICIKVRNEEHEKRVKDSRNFGRKRTENKSQRQYAVDIAEGNDKKKYIVVVDARIEEKHD